MSRGRKSSHDGSGFIAFILLAIFALPIVGIFLLTRKDPSAKVWGAIFTIVGIILWIVLAAASA